MATKVNQQANLLKDAQTNINNATTFAQLKSACLTLVDATQELKQDNRKLENKIRKLIKRVRTID